jgi:chromosome segregation ATPase
MHHKGGRKKVTLESIQSQMQAINNELQATREEVRTTRDEIRTTKKELIEHMDKRFDEHEVYFTAIQEDLIELKDTTKRLESRLTVVETDQKSMGKDLSEFRAETQSFHSGMAAKSGRQDAVIFKLTGILETKNILSSEQSASLRTL